MKISKGLEFTKTVQPQHSETCIISLQCFKCANHSRKIANTERDQQLQSMT